jgi:hypothetical protein
VDGRDGQCAVRSGGDYLVNGILTCGNCHSPKGPPAAIAGKDFSGGLSWDEPPFKVTAPNITPDKETGIGTWTDAQIKTLMRTGIRPNDVHVAMIMPTGFYHIMTDRDLDAVVSRIYAPSHPSATKSPIRSTRCHSSRLWFLGAKRSSPKAR